MKLLMSERRIAASASSSWPTPTSTAGDGRSEQEVLVWAARRERPLAAKGIRNGIPLNVAVQIWPTPRAEHDSGRHRGTPDTLHSAIKTWPTPHANASTGAGAQGRTGGLNLQTAVAFPTPVARDHKGAGMSSQLGNLGKLNPDWVECLQGFPPGWTEI